MIDHTQQHRLEQIVRQEWPSARFLEPGEVIRWAFGDIRRMSAVVMAIQYGTGVWYAFPKQEVTGFRFGFDGSDYLSNFADL